MPSRLCALLCLGDGLSARDSPDGRWRRGCSCEDHRGRCREALRLGLGLSEPLSRVGAWGLTGLVCISHPAGLGARWAHLIPGAGLTEGEGSASQEGGGGRTDRSHRCPEPWWLHQWSSWLWPLKA